MEKIGGNKIRVWWFDVMNKIVIEGLKFKCIQTSTSIAGNNSIENRKINFKELTFQSIYTAACGIKRYDIYLSKVYFDPFLQSILQSILQLIQMLLVLRQEKIKRVSFFWSVSRTIFPWSDRIFSGILYLYIHHTYIQVNS